jgi:imidazolonepropionase
MIINKEGIIKDIGKTKEILEKYKEEDFELVIDATNKSVIPGLCDSHTHVFLIFF